jgi:hypothetical protein
MSDYPNKIDGSVSLPVVRNNIIEAGADSINKIREAVISIERALGIEPNGSKSSLDERLSVSIDQDGSIKQSALASLNILNGPILDSDVAQNAKIKESKLDLEYSTSYLKSQVISLTSEINYLNSQISNLIAKLSIHISGASAHNASSIDVDSIVVSETSSSNITSANNLEDFLEDFISSHVKFNQNATVLERSHVSNQIYIDTNSIDGVEGSDLQTAFESLAGRDVGAYQNIINNYIGSHYPVSSVVGSRGSVDETSDSNIKISYSTYSGSSGLKGSEISVVDGDNLNANIGDYVVIDDIKYVISQINYNSATSVRSLFADGFYPAQSQTIFASFVYKKKESSNTYGLTISKIRKSPSENLDIIHIVNPESPTIVAEQNPIFSQMSSNVVLKIKTEVQTYSFTYSAITTAEHLVTELNDQAISNNIPILFFNYNGRIGISNLIISSQSYLKIISNGQEEISGFSASANNVYGKRDRNIVVGGVEFKSLRIIASEVRVSVSGSTISSLENPFYSYGINLGSCLIIDNKRFLISSFAGNNIVCNGTLTDGEYTMTVYDDSVYVGSAFGLRTVANITQHQGTVYYPYLSHDRTLNIKPIAEYNIPYNQQLPLVSLSILNIITETERIEGFLGYEESTGLFYYRENSEKIYFSSGKLIINGKNSLSIEILNFSSLSSFLIANGEYEYQINVSSFDQDNFLILGKFDYSATGDIREIQSFSTNGYLNSYDLSREFVEFEASNRSLLHDRRPLYGVEAISYSVTSDKYSFEFSAGVMLIDGKFVKINRQIVTSSILASANTKVFVSSSLSGELSLSVAGSNCEFNLSLAENIPVALFEYSNLTLYYTNMLKYGADDYETEENTIYVSSDGSGHVKTFADAIHLAKKYNEAFGVKITKIALSSGLFKIKYFDETNSLNLLYDNGLFIDFPIEIEGQGDSTVLDFDVGSSSESLRRNRIGYINIFGPATNPSEVSSVPSGSFVQDGIVKFSNLKFLDSGVKIKNFAHKKPIPYLREKVIFDNVSFEMSDDNQGRLIYCESNFPSTDTDVFIGNIEVYNCRFKESSIYFERNYEDIMDVTVKDCSYFNESDNPLIESLGGSIKSGTQNGNRSYNNFFVGNRNLFRSQTVSLIEDLGTSDYISNKVTMSDLTVSETILSEGQFKSDGGAQFRNSSTMFIDSPLILLETSNSTSSSAPIEIHAQNQDGYAINLRGGRINGYIRRHLSNTLFKTNLSSTLYEYFIFDFSSSEFISASSGSEIEDDASVRLFADPSVNDGLIVKKITVNIPMIEQNNSINLFFGLGTPSNGTQAYTSFSGTIPIISGSANYVGAIIAEDEDSHSPKYLYPELKVDKESLCMFVGIAKGSSSGDFSSLKIKVELEIEAK